MDSSVTFIGIDLAWQSDKNHSGIVVARGDANGAMAIEASSGITKLDGVADFVARHATERTVVAVDAPLIIRNQSGQRPCETAVSKRFGKYHASAHSTNLTKYPDTPPCRLVRMLEGVGFVHDPQARRHGRWMFEVYPHPALVNVFALQQIIRYKKGRVAQRRVGLGALRDHLSRLAHFAPSFGCSSELVNRLFPTSINFAGAALKQYEDLLDAYFCAYLAFHHWRFGDERNEIIGDMDTGYIVVPRRGAPERVISSEPNRT